MNPCSVFRAIRGGFDFVRAVTSYTIPAGSVQRAGYIDATEAMDPDFEVVGAAPGEMCRCGHTAYNHGPDGCHVDDNYDIPPCDCTAFTLADSYSLGEANPRLDEAGTPRPASVSPGGGEVHSGETPPPGLTSQVEWAGVRAEEVAAKLDRESRRLDALRASSPSVGASEAAPTEPTWVEWAIPAIQDVLANHQAYTREFGAGVYCKAPWDTHRHADFADMQEWREHVSRLIAERIEDASPDPLRDMAEADQRVETAMAGDMRCMYCGRPSDACAVSVCAGRRAEQQRRGLHGDVSKGPW